MLEIMAAVLIIAVLSAAALPSMLQRRRDQRAQTLAQQYAIFVREGRMRAVGRGTAHVVRFSTDVQPRGTLQLFEAVEPLNGTAACANLPRIGVNSCSNVVTWGTGTNSRLVATLDQPDALYNEVSAQFLLNGTATNNVDLCFTPAGRSFIRTGQGAAFQTFNAVQHIMLSSTSNLLKRDVFLLPNGSTQVEVVVP